MAELADALDLGSNAERRAGSNPVPGTTFISSSRIAGYGSERGRRRSRSDPHGWPNPTENATEVRRSLPQMQDGPPFRVARGKLTNKLVISDRPTQGWCS